MNRSDYEKLYKVLSATLDPYKTENTLDKIVVDFRELHKTVRGTRIALRMLDSAVNDVFCDPDFCESHGIWLTSEIEGHLRLLIRVSRPVPDDVSLEKSTLQIKIDLGEINLGAAKYSINLAVFEEYEKKLIYKANSIATFDVVHEIVTYAPILKKIITTASITPNA